MMRARDRCRRWDSSKDNRRERGQCVFSARLHIYDPRINKNDYGLSTAGVQVKCLLAGISSTGERFTRGL